MTNEQTSTLVFKDQAGEYYLLPQATLERGRVPAEHKAEVERVLAEVEGDDVQGHALPAAIWFAGVILEGVVIGYAAARQGTLRGLDPKYRQ
ncbi:MAG: hypothetical protein ACRDJ9_03315 [Dehalococcoidia bacterium]